MIFWASFLAASLIVGFVWMTFNLVVLYVGFRIVRSKSLRHAAELYQKFDILAAQAYMKGESLTFKEFLFEERK